MAIATHANDEQRLDRQKRMESLGKVTDFAAEDYQITIEEINRKDMSYAKGEVLNTSFIMPKTFGSKTQVSDVKTITALKGDSVRGKTRLQVCFSCHRIDGQGVHYGPILTGWGKVRTIEEIVEELVHPSKQLARGYEYPVRISTNGHVAEGMLSNYSKHGAGSEYGGSLNLWVFGGRLIKILFHRKEEKIEMLKNHSWMPQPSQMGLEDQDIRDIAEYLKQL
ncbi:MAG: c-type cytochrome [Planctomycetes bacterium]|nr:c-type cytochrome [Planctomycetota bacterium]